MELKTKVDRDFIPKLQGRAGVQVPKRRMGSSNVNNTSRYRVNSYYKREQLGLNNVYASSVFIKLPNVSNDMEVIKAVLSPSLGASTIIDSSTEAVCRSAQASPQLLIAFHRSNS